MSQQCIGRVLSGPFLGCLLFICFSASHTLSAQSMMKGWEFGPWGGVAYYFGDLNTNYRLNRPNPAGGLMGRYNVNNRISLSLSGNYGRIEAYDSDSENAFEVNRNLSFESDIWEGSLLFEFNFLPYIHGSRDHFFTPYLFGGLTIFNFNPQAVYDGPNLSNVSTGDLVELRPLGTEGQFKGEEYFITTAAITYGFGFKVDLTYEWSINIHIGARDTYTDYLDDVSTVYTDPSDLARARGEQGELAAYMSNRSLNLGSDATTSLGRVGQQRGDDSNDDFYLFAGIGVLYYFGDVRCPNYGKGAKR